MLEQSRLPSGHGVQKTAVVSHWQLIGLFFASGKAFATLPSIVLQVVLPRLPQAVAKLIEEHNQQVLQLLLQTLKQHLASATATATGGRTGPMCQEQQWLELCLPLSRCCYDQRLSLPCLSDSLSGAAQQLQQPDPTGPLLASLASSAQPAVLASPFMALCGAGDAFDSLSELLLAGRQWLRLHAGGIPLLSLQDRRGAELALNAWALDYFKHGQK